MDAIHYNNLQQFCRICLNQLQDSTKSINERLCSYNLQSLPDLALLLKTFFSLDVFKQHHKYPNSICKDCYTTVLKCQQLQKLAQQNEVELQRIAQEGKNERDAQNAAQHTPGDDQLLLPELLLSSDDVEEKQKINGPDRTCVPTFDFTESQDPDTANKSNVYEPEDPSASSVSIKCEPDLDLPLEQQLFHDKLFMKEELHIDNDEVFDDDDEDDDDSDDDNDNESTTSTIYPMYSSSAEDTMFTINDQNNDLPSFAKTSDRYRNRKTYRCTYCDKQSYKLVYLEAHIRSVHEGHDKPFLCRKCDKSFTRYNQLHDHTRAHHPDDLVEDAIKAAEELICNLCQRKYSSKRALREHLKRHAQIKEYVCKHCGIGKVTRTELLIHLRTHEPNVEKFKCTLCPQLFNHKNAISRHIRVVHEGERRFKCGFCNKGFGTRNSQERHELLHSNSRPFACDICHKGFTEMERLTRHMHSHDSSLWKYSCSYCDKPCMTRQNWIVHERRHISDKPYICNICSKGFSTDQDLASHKQTPCSKRFKPGAIVTHTIEEEILS